MAKFNQPIPLRQPDAITHQGGEGFTRQPKDELFLLGVANMVGEDTFYESGQARDTRFVDLIQGVTRADEKWMQSFIGWLRSEANMRSAPIVAAAEYVRAGGTGGRQVVASVLQRADEPGEMLGYWLNTHGRKIPQPIKRGVADALGRLYTERNVLRYDGESKTIRFGDVIELVHPNPRDARQSVLFRHLIDRRHHRGTIPLALETLTTDGILQQTAPDGRRQQLAAAISCGWSWERLAGWLPGGMDAQAWEAVIPNMGLMALTRNLRNFDQAGISGMAAHAVTGKFLDPEEVRRSRQFPLRFLTAWKSVASMRWGMALETALNHSVSNIPKLPGSTLVMVDISGSMQDNALSTRRDSRAINFARPQRWEVATVFAGALSQRSGAQVVFFNTEARIKGTLAPGESMLKFVDFVKPNVGGGTNILGSLMQAYQGEDRVVIITDEQTGTYRWDEFRLHSPVKAHCPVYVFNLAGYKIGVGPNERNWRSIGGLNDASFRLIPLLEARHQGLWPWEVSAPAV